MAIKISERVKDEHMKRFHDAMVRFNGRYLHDPENVTPKVDDDSEKMFYVNVFFPSGEDYNSFRQAYNRSIKKITEKDETVKVKTYDTGARLTVSDNHFDIETTHRKRQPNLMDRFKKAIFG